MRRVLSFLGRLIRLCLTPWRIPKALFIRLRYVLRLIVGLPGDYNHIASLASTRASMSLPAPIGPFVAPSDLDPLALRIERLEAVAHFQRLRPLRADDPAVASPRVSLLMDLRITQSAQRERGISRYATALALTLPTLLPPGSVSYLLDPDLPPPNDIEALRRLGRVVEGAAAIRGLESVSHFLQTCLFDLSKRADELFPAELARFQPKLCAILYDVIPWLFREQYLALDFVFQRYAYQFSMLWQLDKLYAISDSARQDAIDAAHLPPARVETIFGGIDETRWAGLSTRAAPGEGDVVLENRDGDRFTLTAPYWVYVGGDDFRKNLEGAIKAFALVKQALAPEISPQLVIACALPAERRAQLSVVAEESGLTLGEDVIVTGFISDADLATAYRGAFATVFPSLYEGLGLPIIESYHFNRPALAGDNSSLRELTHPECRFDSSDPADIARAMAALHRDPALGEASLAYGREILDRYNWRNAAAAIARDVNAGGVGGTG
jgi:glycosyltransferase involved in cell wall biosynthesis